MSLDCGLLPKKWSRWYESLFPAVRGVRPLPAQPVGAGAVARAAGGGVGLPVGDGRGARRRGGRVAAGGPQRPLAPEKATRNRKPLERPVALAAGWELRFGPGNRFRVFYRVDADQRQ